MKDIVVEERFRELFMNMHDGVAIYRASDNGADFIIQGVNPAGARLVQVNATAVVGRSVQAVFPGIVQMGLLDVFRSVWHTGHPRQHPITRYKDGKIRLWVENYVCRLGTGEIVAIFRDLTAHKNAEKQLRQSEQTMKTVLNASPNYVSVKDHRGAYLLANQTIADLYGMPEKEMVGRTDMELAERAGLHVADVQSLCRHDAEVLDRQQPLTVAKENFIRKDGTVHWLRTATIPIRLPGHPRCVLGVATDVTDQVSAEEQRTLLFTAIAQSPEAIVITDREGCIQYVNPGFETTTGYSRAEAVGKSSRILKSGRQDDAFYHAMWQTLTQGRVWSGRIVNRRKNGEFFTEEATISPVIAESGQITHYVAVKRDISKEIEIETRLRQSQKMEAIGTLAGGIAHDFNNILTSTIGFAELALDEVEKGSPLEDYLKEIRISGMRARDLVNQILAFAHQTEERAEPFNLGSIVREVAKLLRATVPATIAIRLTVESEVTVLADPTRIHQVCMNLCTNAVHAMKRVAVT
ncbi:hypothetical protein DESC_480218 [Desulfosarcina cetonica]|uniref:PAS domain-containing sensor histidine kinase n=1 Tax=Desulfosarcina cetonica TaxID=90730 RepID=UPI0006D17A27|nr:PAS domain-containing sensor histidine kinase [Desulfosarcina cetonica]VTR66508.1 hypothetical protein DESC_480218 [Desulfosarcina cetonica]